MKYILYIILLYIFLPLNSAMDFIAILLFHAAMTENGYFAIFYAFGAGLLIDLYYPSLLGLNMITCVVLVQTLLFIRRYVAHSPVITLGLFTTFFITKMIVQHAVIAFGVNASLIILTLACFFPMYMLLNRVFHRVWMKL